MRKRSFVLIFIISLLLIAGCQQGYFGQGTVGERLTDTSQDNPADEDSLNAASKPVGDDSGYNPRNDPTFIDCTLTENAINPFCTPETGVGIEADSSFMGFSAQDKILRSLDLEQSRMDNLAAKGKLAYVSSTDQWKLTLQTIQEINVLIGLPKDATAADREKWYADWAIQEDQKFAAAIAKGTEEQIAAEYDSRIQELVDQSRLAAGEGAEDAIAQALDAADKAAALRAEKERVLNTQKQLENYLRALETRKAQTYEQSLSKKEYQALIWAVDNQQVLKEKGITTYIIDDISGKTTIFIANDGNYFDLVTDGSGKSSLKKLSSSAEIPTSLDSNLKSRQYIAETVREGSEITAKLGYEKFMKGATFKDGQGNIYIITPEKGGNVVHAGGIEEFFNRVAEPGINHGIIIERVNVATGKWDVASYSSTKAGINQIQEPQLIRDAYRLIHSVGDVTNLPSFRENDPAERDLRETLKALDK